MPSNPLKLTLCGISLQNPVIAASGTFGFGHEYAEILDVSRLGGISGKGLTLNGSAGNKGMRVYETPSGMLNSIGLENPGVRHFVTHEADYMRALGPAVIANLGGHCEEDYLEGAHLLNDADIDILELNISCPNVKAGGMAFGMLPETAADITQKVKAVSRHPVMVKLSPNAPDLVAVARACESAGADALSLVNTFLGMAIDVKQKCAVFENVYAGLSGPAILPIALRMVHQVAHAVTIPVVGMGGITSAEDALKFLMAGAVAVQVGTMTFADPKAMLRIIDGLSDYCAQEGLDNLQQIVGIL
ncbi:MAG: dihydroorotate dehydrogenase [Eubacteriales bacterium]|nr:dihydroorotate dehydrogenase [Eubacteriales bacterium]